MWSIIRSFAFSLIMVSASAWAQTRDGVQDMATQPTTTTTTSATLVATAVTDASSSGTNQIISGSLTSVPASLSGLLQYGPVSIKDDQGNVLINIDQSQGFTVDFGLLASPRNNRFLEFSYSKPGQDGRTAVPAHQALNLTNYTPPQLLGEDTGAPINVLSFEKADYYVSENYTSLSSAVLKMGNPQDFKYNIEIMKKDLLGKETVEKIEMAYYGGSFYLPELKAINNAEADGERTIVLKIAKAAPQNSKNPVNLGEITQTTIHVIDDDSPNPGFAHLAPNVATFYKPDVCTKDDPETPENEQSAKPIEIKVIRYGGAAGAVSVDAVTEDHSAKANLHYLPINQTINFQDGESGIKVVSIYPICENYPEEESVMFYLNLQNPTGGMHLGMPTRVPISLQSVSSGCSLNPSASSHSFLSFGIMGLLLGSITLLRMTKK